MTKNDFSDCPVTGDVFTGTEKKIGILFDDRKYILKFQKRDQFGIRNNHLSEHIGSNIFNMVGIESQHTILGTYKGENVVACEFFVRKGEQFVPFNDVRESSLDSDPKLAEYTYDDIMLLLRANKKLTSVDSTIETFWNVFIIDCLLGNFDRHGANWGFLKRNNQYRLAPVFDNGSCLYPKMNDETEMLAVIGSQKETEMRISGFPLSQIKIDGKKSSYADVIGSLRFKECNEALKRMFPKIDMDVIEEFISDIDGVSETHRRFYIHMLDARYDAILKRNYERLVSL